MTGINIQQPKLRVARDDFTGGGYNDFWNFEGRYRVVKGSRASKKSKTTALWIIWKMMKPQYKMANTLVVRKVFRTLKDSCFTELKWAIHRLGVDASWEIKESPLEMTFKRTGQKIYFRGLDDPQKITSITAEHGELCWLWLEEAYEITRESDFDMLDESIRGQTDCFKQVTLTLNPWNEKHWIKARFFDKPDPDVLAMTTTYLQNEWLDDSDRKIFEQMKENNPRRYRVAGLGEWGITEGVVYENWTEREFSLSEIQRQYNLHTAHGIDFGYTNDPSAVVIAFIDTDKRKLFVYDEIYKTGLSNRRIYEEICNAGYGKERFTADSAEPKSIDELRGYGLRVTPAKKGQDSVNNGIQFIQDYEIVIHPRCVNFLTEINNYTWDEDRFGNKLNRPIDDFNHALDAMRYGVEQYIGKKGWLY